MINKAIIFGAVCVGCPICICQNLLGKYRQCCGVCAVGVTNLNNSCACIDSFLVLWRLLFVVVAFALQVVSYI